MIRIMNGFFSMLKFLLLGISFFVTFYIVMSMYERLEKNILSAIPIFIPYLILFLLMSFNLIFKQKQVTRNIFFNLTVCLVFGVFIFVGWRSLMDDYMLVRYKNDYQISFHYFSDMIAPLKAMLYLLIFGDLFLIFTKKREPKEKIQSLKKEEVVAPSLDVSSTTV